MIRSTSFLALSLTLLATSVAPDASWTADPFEDAVHHARRILEGYRAATGAPALQVAVALDGRIVWSEAFGMADQSRGTRATTHSRFRIASVSKLMTGTLTATLADAGMLDLDRPIGEYLTDLPASWHGITPRMLVHHTSGIGHYRDGLDGLDTTRYASTREALARFQDRPLAHAPGQAETYSSFAYTVLALAIEHAVGRPFLDVMRETILEPLGMSRTGPDIRSSPAPDRTAFYELRDDGSVQIAPVLDLSGRWAGSGYLSTAEDLVRFGAAHTSHGSLPAGVRALVAERAPLPGGRLTTEGFGWGPRSDWDQRPVLWGDGGMPGSRGGLLVYPADGLAIAILTNVRGLSLERGDFVTIARLFLSARQGQRFQPPPIDVVGHWTGTVAQEGMSLGVALTIPRDTADRAGQVSFGDWRSLSMVDAFRFGDTTWVVSLDRQGIFPIWLTSAGDSARAVAPRTGWTFGLRRQPARGGARRRRSGRPRFA